MNPLPWYADIANCLANEKLYNDLHFQERNRLFTLCRKYFWEEPYLFHEGPDGVIRRCIPDHEQQDVLIACHDGEAGGHLGAKRTSQKVYEAGFYWPSIFIDAR